MKKWIVAFILLLSFVAESPAQLVTVNNFDDVQFWTGSGENRSVLVLQFSASDTPTSIAWGYRWSGSATAASMIFSIAGNLTGTGMPAPMSGSDSRLSVDGTYYPPDPYFDGGYFLNSITYNQVSLPAPWSQGLRTIENNYFVDETYPVLYTLVGNGIWTGNLFNPSSLGISDVALSNGGWVAFAQTDGFNQLTLTQPVSAVPEPTGLVLLVVGCLFFVGRRFVEYRLTSTKLQAQ